MIRPYRARPHRRPSLAALLLSIGGLALTPGWNSLLARAADPMAHGHEMTEAEMKRLVDERYAGRELPPNGSLQPQAAATYRVINFRFDADNNPNGTPRDTVHINTGETVDWVLVSGSHTTTSGTGGADPQSGDLWDAPVDAGHTLFSRVFNDAGTFPFYCVFHESMMKGVVVVTGQTGVAPIDGPSDRLGFVAGPSPNPSAGRVTFRFNLRAEGHVSVEVFDVTGRRVARPVDSDLGAGTWVADWDGRFEDGSAAPSGVYYLKLITPVGTDLRPVSIVR
jgi:plastocyanin